MIVKAQPEPEQEVTVTTAKPAAPKVSAATFEQLLKKVRRTATFKLHTANDAGEDVVLEVRAQALSSTRYDQLVSEHPPNSKQKALGADFNGDTFGPALISECLIDPKLTVEQVTELWHSPDWAPGEVTSLYRQCMVLCMQGIDVPFTVGG